MEAALTGGPQGVGGVEAVPGGTGGGFEASPAADGEADATAARDVAAPAAAVGGTGGDGCTSNPGSTDTGVSGNRVRVGATYAESSLIPGQLALFGLTWLRIAEVLAE